MKSKMEVDKGGNKYWKSPNGDFHREDGPAIEWLDGDKNWYLNGKLHREDGPAIEYSDGYKRWYLNGKLHREDGPAIDEWFDGGKKEWYLNGNLHCVCGPAVEHISGDKEWWKYGKRHRVDGPAIEFVHGGKQWYLNDIEYSEQEYKKEIRLIKIKQIL